MKLRVAAKVLDRYCDEHLWDGEPNPYRADTVRRAERRELRRMATSKRLRVPATAPARGGGR